MGRFYLEVNAERTTGLIQSNDAIAEEFIGNADTSVSIDDSEYELSIEQWSPPRKPKFDELRAALEPHHIVVKGRKYVPQDQAATELWKFLKGLS